MWEVKDSRLWAGTFEDMGAAGGSTMCSKVRSQPTGGLPVHPGTAKLRGSPVSLPVCFWLTWGGRTGDSEDDWPKVSCMCNFLKELSTLLAS
jgi:hypothetical protein